MSEYNKSISNIKNFHTVPCWLDRNYLEKVLQHYKHDKSVKVLEFTVDSATAKGENYASIMFRITVEFTLRDSNEITTSNYILKMSFEDDEFAAEKFSQYNIYKREMNIYEKISPQLKNILKNSNQDWNLFPKIIFVDYENDTIILEDLAIKSYVTAERKNGLDMMHAKLVLQKLAKMQAAAAVLAENNPEIFQNFDRGIFNRYTDAFRSFFEGSIHTCGKLVTTWNDYREYGEKLIKLTPYVMEYGKRVFDVKKNHFNTLVHGDLWTNNVMFKYDDRNEPIDVLMIDFQFACWGSPAIDLHYFFNTSLRDEIRLHNQDELVQYYYQYLTHTLQALQYKGKIPSLREFWVQFIEKKFYALTSACIVQPIMIHENTENADFATLMGEDQRSKDFKWTVYSNEKVHKNLKQLLPIFDRNGLLDIE